MTMILIMLTLFIGGLAAWMIEGWNRDLPRWISIGSITLAALLLAPLFQSSGQMLPLALGISSPWLEYINVPWIPHFGIGFVFAIDGLSLLLVALTIFLGFVAVLSSWSEIDKRPGFFQFNLMWTLAGSRRSFCLTPGTSSGWEVMLIPMYLLIAIWGHEKKSYAAMKFFLFTQVSGLIMLVAILALVTHPLWPERRPDVQLL